MAEAGGDVHVVEQRRAEPDGEPGRMRLPHQAARGDDGEANGQEAVERGAQRDCAQVRPRVAVGRHLRSERAPNPRGDVGDGVERRPENRRSHRPVAVAEPGGGLPHQITLVERPGDGDAAVVEVAVLVVERDVVVEPERPEVGEVAHLVPRVETRCDGGQCEDEQQGRHDPLPATARAEPAAACLRHRSEV